jgi:hypothetical protein
VIRQRIHHGRKEWVKRDAVNHEKEEKDCEQIDLSHFILNDSNTWSTVSCKEQEYCDGFYDFVLR